MLAFGVVAEPQMRSRHLKSREHHWSEPSDDLIGLGVVATAAAAAAAVAAVVLEPRDGRQLRFTPTVSSTSNSGQGHSCLETLCPPPHSLHL